MVCKDCLHYDVCLLERDDNKDKLTADGLFKKAEEDCAYFKDKSLVVELPCLPGEKLYVITKKEFRVGNDYEPPCKNDCELYEPAKYDDWGVREIRCKKSIKDTCPEVVKPVTVELFEVTEKSVYPCYRVDYEGNSTIDEWYVTREEAEKALERMKEDES